jgi:hypothetical protein
MYALGLGADEIELAVDADRGILLRAEARFAGKPFRLLEVREARFDEELPPAPFVFEPPPGEIVRSVEDVYGVDYVRISSDTLDLDALLAVGGSLVEAPTELPPVLYS